MQSLMDDILPAYGCPKPVEWVDDLVAESNHSGVIACGEWGTVTNLSLNTINNSLHIFINQPHGLCYILLGKVSNQFRSLVTDHPSSPIENRSKESKCFMRVLFKYLVACPIKSWMASLRDDLWNFIFVSSWFTLSFKCLNVSFTCSTTSFMFSR